MPQTSLTAELRAETAPLTVEDNAVNFTAEHAASSLSGFQRGTFEARDDETDSVRTATHGDNTASPGYPPSAEGSRHRPPNAER